MGAELHFDVPFCSIQGFVHCKFVAGQNPKKYRTQKPEDDRLLHSVISGFMIKMLTLINNTTNILFLLLLVYAN